jgi:hypothetical protein
VIATEQARWQRRFIGQINLNGKWQRQKLNQNVILRAL